MKCNCCSINYILYDTVSPSQIESKHQRAGHKYVFTCFNKLQVVQLSLRIQFTHFIVCKMTLVPRQWEDKCTLYCLYCHHNIQGMTRHNLGVRQMHWLYGLYDNTCWQMYPVYWYGLVVGTTLFSEDIY